MILKKQFETIYKDNYQKVFGLCLGYVSGSDALAKDLTQDVFIKVWNNLKSFRNEANISTWIYRITVNTCLQELRKKKYLPLKKDIVDQVNYNNLEKENQFNRMYSCINKLSSENKSIILLELEDLPQEDIAKIIGIKSSALRTRIHRIKEKLSKCVKK